MADAPSNSTEFRLRFSLRTLLLIIVAFVCLATIWKLYTDLSVARKELVELRKRGGHLELTNVDMIHAVKIPTEDRLKWIYRIYIPKHIELDLYSYGWDFDNGYPKNKENGTYPKVLGPGEHLLTYTLSSNSLGKSTIDYVIRSPNKTAKTEIVTSANHSWATDSNSCVYTISPSDFKSKVDSNRWRKFHTLQIDETKPFALMRFGPKNKAGESIRRPGVMVWIDPRKMGTAQ